MDHQYKRSCVGLVDIAYEGGTHKGSETQDSYSRLGGENAAGSHSSKEEQWTTDV